MGFKSRRNAFALAGLAVAAAFASYVLVSGPRPVLNERPVQYPPTASLLSDPILPSEITARAVSANQSNQELPLWIEPHPGELTAGPLPTPGAPKKRGQGIYYGTPDDGLENDSQTKAADGSFLSITFDDNGAVTNGFRFIPPDSHAAAGPDHVIVVANVSIRIHEKDGNVVLNDSLQNFFAPLTPTTFTFDPKVIYDQYSDRWVVVTLETTDVTAGDPMDTSFLFIAVSDSADPLGNWTMASINTLQVVGSSLTWADYPGLGLDDEGIYITTNQFNLGSYGSAFANRLWAIEKGEGLGGFYDGNTPNVLVFNLGLPDPMTMQSSHMFGPPPGTTNMFLVGYSGLNTGGVSEVQVLRVDSVFSGATGNLQYVPIGVIEGNPISGYQDAQQSGSATRIETNDKRTLNTVWRDDQLWTTMTIGPPTGTAQTSAHWNRVDTSNLGALTVDASGNIDGEDVATNTWAFFPSIAVNSLGDAVLGYSTSASSIFPSAHYAFMSGEGLATFGPSQLLRAGEAAYVRTFGGPRNRWGDYSGAAVDPSNQCFWIYNEYAQTQGTLIGGELGRWGTAVEKYCPCTETINLPSNEWLLYTPSCNIGDDNTVTEVFSEVLDPLDYGVSERWIVYRYNASTPAYEIVGLNEPLIEGSGYWIKTLDGAETLRVDGINNVGLDIPLVGNASGQLNMVGHPHEFDVCWEDATVFDGVTTYTLDTADPLIVTDRACDIGHPLCVMSRVMQQWNGTAHQAFDGVTPMAEGTLEPMRGMWVEAFQSGLSLRVPRSAGSGCTSRASNRSVGGDWALSMTATSGTRTDFAVLGRASDALDANDYHDLPEFAPFGSNWLTIVFPHTDWGSRSGDYQTDFRAPGTNSGTNLDEWVFEVRVSDVAQPITLTWEGPSDEIMNAWLVDLATGDVITPQPGGSYTFQPQSTSHQFIWWSGAASEWIYSNGFEGNGD